MTIYLVRHAVALARKHWSGDDLERPLTSRGDRQAAALADQLSGVAVDRIYTSPAVRCIATVQPLADARSLPLQQSPALAEGTGTAATSLVAEAAHLVMCAHGDNLVELLAALAGHLDEVADDPPFAKGATWVLRREGGTVVAAEYLKPPA